MAIIGVQLIYRLQDFIRLLIDYRDGGGTPPDTFNLYWSSDDITYTKFLEGIINKPSDNPAIRGKILVEIIPSTITSWDNERANYFKLTEVIGGVEGALEGPMDVPTRQEGIQYSEKSIMYGFNSDDQKFIPVKVNTEGKIITA